VNKRTLITDPARLEAVEDSGLLDSPPEPDFDRLARLAAQLLHAPGAFVTILTDDRQYLKSAIENGHPSYKAGSSTPISHSFCQHVIAGDAPFIVEDARLHELVKDNPAVADGVIAYAGIPLRTQDGQSIGALCVVDSKPRQWSEEQIENLRALARGAMQLIGERQAPRERAAGEGFNPDAKSLLDCVAHHLRASNSYTQLVAGSGPLDLEAEAAARTRLMESVEDLRESFAHHGARAAQAEPELAVAVSRYLEADLRRGQAAREFAQGTTDLASLESAIQQHLDSADSLRLSAIDYGADV
jgi:signal transduction protein with GAF and PtsI domain